MKKWKIEVYTDSNYYSYSTDDDDQKARIIKDERAKAKVVEIFVNRIRCYKRNT